MAASSLLTPWHGVFVVQCREGPPCLASDTVISKSSHAAIHADLKVQTVRIGSSSESGKVRHKRAYYHQSYAEVNP